MTDVLAELSDLTSRVSRFKDDLTAILQEVILDNRELIIDMNADEQLYEQGINTYGVKIEDYAPYADFTIEIKREKGQPTDRVTLRDEGDFESSFDLRVNKESFEIFAGDAKTEKLKRKYGDEILGLTEENLIEFIVNYMMPSLQAEFIKELGNES